MVWNYLYPESYRRRNLFKQVENHTFILYFFFLIVKIGNFFFFFEKVKIGNHFILLVHAFEFVIFIAKLIVVKILTLTFICANLYNFVNTLYKIIKGKLNI